MGQIVLTNSLTGLVIIYTAFNTAFATFLMQSFFDGIPKDLEEAAMIDGCTRAQAMRRVIVPLTLPGMGATLGFVFTAAWSELLFALMLTRAPTGPQPDLTVRRALPAAVAAGLVGVLLVATVVAGFRDVRVELDEAVVGTAEVTGDTIFRMWVLPFEVLSVLLLAALVGAIVLSRLRGDD